MTATDSIFVVLDPNNLLHEGKYIPYGHANFYLPSEQRTYVDPEQLNWLRKDLTQTNLPCIIFSHQSMENRTACQNQEKVRTILEEVNAQSTHPKVIAAFSGHDHTDYVKTINDIHYIQINSMSYKWVGSKYSHLDRFSGDINKKKPQLRNTLPYRDPLYALVSIGQGKIDILGLRSDFIKPGPEDLGIDLSLSNKPMVPYISDYQLSI